MTHRSETIFGSLLTISNLNINNNYDILLPARRKTITFLLWCIVESLKINEFVAEFLDFKASKILLFCSILGS